MDVKYQKLILYSWIEMINIKKNHPTQRYTYKDIFSMILSKILIILFS